MNVGDNQNDGLVDDELLAGGEQSEETVEKQKDSDIGSDTETEKEECGDESETEASDDEGDKDEQPKRKCRTGSEHG